MARQPQQEYEGIDPLSVLRVHNLSGSSSRFRLVASLALGTRLPDSSSLFRPLEANAVHKTDLNE